jgi:lysophospholipase L1-like esterase
MKKIFLICFSLLLIFATTSTTKHKIFVIGDSTACLYDSAAYYPRTGWAQVLKDYVKSDSVIIADSALSGRSSRSFYNEGHWTAIKKLIKSGDYVIIQFGHNDEKTSDTSRGTLPGSTFEQYLSIYIDQAESLGAVPILATPIERNKWTDSGTLQSTHITSDGDYPQAIRNLASKKGIVLIDATELTHAYFEKIGEDSTTKLFMVFASGVWPNYSSGDTDNTHLQQSGARAISQLVVNNIVSQKIPVLYTWIAGVTGLSKPVEVSHENYRNETRKIIGINGQYYTGRADNIPSFNIYDAAGRTVSATQTRGIVNRIGTGIYVMRPDHAATGEK